MEYTDELFASINLSKNFLDDRLAYRVITNLINRYPAGYSLPMAKIYLQEDPIKDGCIFIIDSFTWNKTIEGHTFWSTINSKIKNDKQLNFEDYEEFLQ